MTLIADVFPKLRTSENVVRLVSKKSHFIGPFHKQDSKWDQILLKSEEQNLWHIYWSVWIFSWKKSLIVILNILRLLFNTLTFGLKYSLLKRYNLTRPIQMQLSQKQKIFLNFSWHFWLLDDILNIFQKKMTLITDVFRKLRTPRNMVW